MSTKRKGVIGALLDEYQIVIADLKSHIHDIRDDDIAIVLDTETQNPSCVSIQSVLTHVIFCGYNYVYMMDVHKGNSESPKPPRIKLASIKEYEDAIDQMYAHTLSFFEGVSESEMAMFNPEDKLVTGWGQIYDYEQLMEHAIVHISRHRRQIQHFKQILAA